MVRSTMTTITEDNTTWELWVRTQMKRTDEIDNLDGWELITNGSSNVERDLNNPLRTLRVNETCILHEKMNRDFNNGNTSTYFTTREGTNRATDCEVITIDEMIEVLRYVVADGRFSITLKVYDAEEVAGAVQSLNIPKSVGKKITHTYGRQVNPNADWLDDDWVYTDREGIEISYKVNGSTGERNETGEKRINRFLKEF